ncbi:Alcohol dehydrogenase [bacterium HR25]|jgi:D-arabinose 1-dehydrogenase-like Zn-dependent alcohol dehydrogenase|nr:Alcohol dehydrogenase [bacterium HR25]
MKAAVLETFRQPLVVKEVPDPTPGPGDAIVRVEGEGICRSDWHAWMGDWEWIGLKPQLPIVPGHEMAGVVEEVGPGVRRFKKGDRVLSPVVWACGSCEFCLKGRQNLCATPNIPGFSTGGGYGRLVKVINADLNLIPLPEGIDFITAAAMGCRFPTAYHAVRDQGRVKGGEWVAVHGCGGVGLSAVQIAAALGANVVAVDISDEKLAKARELGAVATVNAARENAPEAVKEITKGGAHVSVDALGIQTTCLNSVLSLRKGGRHVQVGLTTQAEKGQVPVPVDMIVAMEIEFLGSIVHPQSGYDGMLEMVTSGKVNPNKLVTRTVRIEEASSVLESMTEFGTVGMVIINQW